MALTQAEAEDLADCVIKLVKFHHSRREYLSRERLTKALMVHPEHWAGGNGIIPVFRPNTEPCVFDDPAA